MKKLTWIDRLYIEKHQLHLSKRQLAKDLGCCLKTVYNEFSRGGYWHTDKYAVDHWRYSADIAQQDYDYKQTAKGCPVKLGSRWDFICCFTVLFTKFLSQLGRKNKSVRNTKRMKIKIYGKVHLEGTSKRTGNACNFNQVHYLPPSRGVEGLAAKTLNLDPATYPLNRIILNTDYNVEFDDRGYPAEVSPVK